MSDIAVLGLAIDSRDATKATAALNGLAAAAKPAETATSALSKAAEAGAKSHAGLSTQAMAAQHSVRSLVEAMASGQPISMALGQQLSHLSYAATGPGGLSGAFKQAAGSLLGLLSPATLVAGGLAAVGVAGALSLHNIAETGKAFDDTARSIGTTVAALRGLDSAAAVKGIATPDFLKGMERFGALVEDAKHGMGSLAETFRGAGIHASTFDDYLSKGADLIKNAGSDAQRLNLLQEMGLPRSVEWVRLMQAGGQGLRDAAADAVKFGETADEALIAKARKFDEEWAKTFKNFGTGWRNALVEGSGYLEAFSGKVNALLMRAGINVPKNLLADALNGGPTPGSRLSAASDVSGFYTGTGAGVAAAGPKVKTAAERQKEISDQQTYISLLGQTATAEQAARQVQLQADAAYLSTGVSVGKARIDQLKQLAIEQANGVAGIKAGIDAANVEAATVGLSVGATAAYTAEQNALNTAKQRGTILSEASRAQISSEATALGQAAAQADLMRSAYNGLVLGPMQAFNSAIQQGSTFLDALKKSGVSALNAVANKLTEMAAQNLWGAAFGGSSGGFLSSLFGMGGGRNATDGIGGFGPTAPVGINHAGYGPGDSFPSRILSMSAFHGAPRFHTGIGPGERAAVIRNDESVLTPGQMKALAPARSNGGSPISITMNFHTDASGADPAAIHRLESSHAQLKAELPHRVVAAVASARQRRIL